MKTLIELHDLTKSFAHQTVIKNYSYSFKSQGLYILLGSSGSGKTTLLNLISGLIPFNSGEIIINGQTYTKQVNNEKILDISAYITQDSKLIEYLSILDNLKLCCNNINKIEEYATKLNVKDILNKYPKEISGGEKQRVILIQFLLLNKQIFFLDEVSSSLDYENKIKLFQILKELSKTKLIIFATHDNEATKYADEVLSINESQKCKNSERVTIQNVQETKENLYRYIKKQNKYYNHFYSKLIIIFVFVVSLLIVFMCSDFDKKMFNTSLQKYQLNYLLIDIPKNYDINNIKEKYHITDIIYDYKINYSIIENQENLTNPDYETLIVSLPEKEFPFPELIKYGSYFTNTNQVIITENKAKEMALHPEKLIGTKVKIKFPDKTEEMEIVGIFSDMSEKAMKYFKTERLFLAEQQYEFDGEYFVNGRYFDKYINDDIIGQNEKVTGKENYFIFFKKQKDLINFYKDYFNEKQSKNDISVEKIGTSFVEQEFMLKGYANYLYPIIVISIITVIAFYLQLKTIDLKYSEYHLGIYESLGYKSKDIKKAIIKYQILEIISLYIISLIIAITTCLIYNYLNSIYNFTQYIVFSFNIYYILLIFLLIIIFSIIIPLISLRHLKHYGWLNISYKGRDLL